MEADDPIENYRQQNEYESYDNPYQDPTLVLTPLEQRTGGDVNYQDESYEPFRLEMTPPDQYKRRNSNRFQESVSRSESRLVLIPSRLDLSREPESQTPTISTPDDHNISEVESLCVDVVLRVDSLLSSSTPNKTMGSRSDLLILRQEAKDYLKILHSLLKEEWVAKENITQADNDLLCRRVPSFVDLSIRLEMIIAL